MDVKRFIGMEGESFARKLQKKQPTVLAYCSSCWGVLQKQSTNSPNFSCNSSQSHFRQVAQGRHVPGQGRCVQHVLTDTSKQAWAQPSRPPCVVPGSARLEPHARHMLGWTYQQAAQHMLSWAYQQIAWPFCLFQFHIRLILNMYLRFQAIYS